MFCVNCGTKNNDNAKFCEKCGAQLMARTGPDPIQEQPQPQVQPQPQQLPKPKAPRKPLKKGAIIGIIAGAVAVVAVICVLLFVGKTINLNNYLRFETQGYNGYGTASAYIDWDSIERDYGKKVSFTSKAKSEYYDYLFASPIALVRECVSVKLDKNSDLSNGDNVSYTFEIEEELADYVSYKIETTDGSFGVGGLTDVQTFDAFEGLEAEFSGIAPNGTVNLNYTGSRLDYYDFSCDRTSGLSNGETITVSISEGLIEYCIESFGAAPEKLSKEFTVSGLSSYMRSVSELDNDALSLMQQQAEDVYYARMAQNWGEGETLKSLSYIGTYFLTQKSQDGYGNYSELYLVYRARIRNKFSSGADKYNKLNDNYWYICFSNLMVGDNGKVSPDLASYTLPGDTYTIDSGVSDGWWSTKTWYYTGYNTLDNLYRTVVTSKLDRYNHEDNVTDIVVSENKDGEKKEAKEEAEETTLDTAEEYTRVSEQYGDFIFPDSDIVLLTKSDLKGLTQAELRIARNEIYARHGRMFKDEALQKYFESCPWYVGYIEPDAFKDEMLSKTEAANKDLIVKYEKEMGYR